MKTIIYLSGGFDSNWRQSIIDCCKDRFIFINPKENKCVDPKHYTTWDLHYIRKCDILFAYLELGNPSGVGLIAEVGYAKALNKTIILVNEKTERKYNFLEQLADVYFYNLEYGIEYLSKFL